MEALGNLLRPLGSDGGRACRAETGQHRPLWNSPGGDGAAGWLCSPEAPLDPGIAPTHWVPHSQFGAQACSSPDFGESAAPVVGPGDPRGSGQGASVHMWRAKSPRVSAAPALLLRLGAGALLQPASLMLRRSRVELEGLSSRRRIWAGETHTSFMSRGAGQASPAEAGQVFSFGRSRQAENGLLTGPQGAPRLCSESAASLDTVLGRVPPAPGVPGGTG